QSMWDPLVRTGSTVLLPVVRRDELDWARYAGPTALTRGPWGLIEPAGPRLGEAALARAGVIVVPAMAVDRDGLRLGKGRGFYDRSLGHRDPAALLVAMVRDPEVVQALPGEAHDVAMHAVLTPLAGLRALPLD
ncbi:MAG: 5-formyltetrahydrofolate cyclo-ligase, partial [Sciscionella sp.]